MVKTGQHRLAVRAVTELSLPSVVPPLVLAGRADQLPRGSAAPRSARPPLPLMALSEKRAGSAVYGLSTLGAGGRIADGVIMAALGWAPGGRLDIRVSRGLIAIFRDERGVFRLTGRSFLHLPVAARRWCELSPGDRVLLAAYPEGGLLVVHPPAALDAVVDRVHAAALGADANG
ncbi:hypothetical protein ACIA5D_50670 [Actinoplanes sp. NPDC051513]|uniref:hypothetical protein n=1 Tax=Actinoplanes sp. NPDC051513 TaxID=3363908 RepID=UPI0037BC2586